jgi:type I restriction-modification system DNA methylase subunit
MPQATKESFARALDALVRKYEADRDTYRSSQYNEAQTRTQFITPLLEALGWDVRNEGCLPYNLQEVREEKGETHGRPDYTFRINGQTKFFLEAKKPSGGLHDEDILQTKRYAWNSRDIFFAAICDFEDLYFFDASLRPDQKRPYDGEAFHIVYTAYYSNIDKLWELSRDRVAAGSLDQFLRKDRKSLLQKIPVDKDFLENLTNWRQELASTIHGQNPQYGAHELNEIVQRLLDRIIFIRIAEDRKVIDPLQLWQLVGIWEDSGGRRNIMEQLVQLFRDFNERFNGEIFKPHACEEIKIESHVLPKIIRQLYPPKSNYRFDVIGVELLGSIYERYLGNTLRITPKRVFIEPKPEVRKAGGVYYTPQYIVDYIVKNTVGKLVEGKTPKEVDKIRILDPACGSGSFLIGAFQFLIDWHLNYYREHPKEAKSETILAMTRTDEDGNLRLSFAAKSLILQKNLYGVDIDQQAVEVTMMSLYLKMLEGELGIQIPKQDKLPELKYNIRCGNSLIGPDIEKDKPFSPEDRQRINPFDWSDRERGFGDILKSGGFDAVIGNPPYGAAFTEAEKEYLNKFFKHQTYQLDSYLLFVERTLGLTRARGLCGLIIPNPWLTNLRLDKIRRFVSNSVSVLLIVHFMEKVFPQATVDTEVVVIENAPPADNDVAVEFVTQSSGQRRLNVIPQSRWRNLEGRALNIFLTEPQFALMQKIRHRGEQQLDSLCEINVGIKPYQVGKGKPKQTESDVIKRVFDAQTKKNKTYRPYLRGSDLRRYAIVPDGRRWISYGPWLAEPRPAADFAAPEKILIRQTGDSLLAALDTQQYLSLNNTHVVVPNDSTVPLRYLIGILNSKLMNFYYQGLNPEVGEALAEVKAENVKGLPIHVARGSAESKMCEQLTLLVGKILNLSRKKYAGDSSKSELASLESEIAETDAQIDNLVYELYGITQEERKIVEAHE